LRLTLTSSDAESHPLAVSDGALIFNQPSGWDVAWISKNSHAEYSVRAQHLDANGGDLWTNASFGGVTVAFNTEEMKNLALTSDVVGPNFATKDGIPPGPNAPASGATAYDVLPPAAVDGSGAVQWGNSGRCQQSDQRSRLQQRCNRQRGSGNVIIGWDDLHTETATSWRKAERSGAKQWLGRWFAYLPRVRRSNHTQADLGQRRA
jgi:hypothetical protein